MLRAARHYLDSILLGSATGPAPRDIDRLRAQDRSALRGKPLEEQRYLDAAFLLVHVYDENLERARELADDAEASWPNPLDHEISIDATLAFDSALAVFFLAAGEGLRALKWAAILSQHVVETADQRWHYCAHGLSAAVLLLNGELTAADRQLARSGEIMVAEGWDPNRISYLHAATEMLAAYLAQDTPRLARLAPRARLLAARFPAAESLAALCEAAHLERSGDVFPASARYQRVAEGAIGPLGPRIIREFARYLQGLVLLRGGEPLRAKQVVEGERAVGNHVFCPNLIRAAGKLQMADYRGVLAATSECVRPAVKHSRWNLSWVLLMRSIAHLKSGHHEQAFRAAMLLRDEADSPDERFGVFASVIPRSELEDLLSFVHDRSPWEQMQKAGQSLAALPADVTLPAAVGAFTPRERIVAHHLRSDRSLTEISEVLFVSHGTVTAQASSVYKKLGVRNRQDAVTLLEGLGFFESAPV